MKYAFTAAAFGLGASAGLLRRQQAGCCTQINVSGNGVQGPLGQISDGQNRVGPGSSAGATYCLNNGGFTDSSGRGCILTSPSTQFQCDTGAQASGGFSISSNGQVQENGSGTFYACAADNNGDYNIYTTPVPNMKCSEVSLTAQNQQCYNNGAGQSSAPASSPAASSPAAQQSSSAASSPAAQQSSPAASSPSAYQSSAAASSPAAQQSSPAANTCPAPQTVTQQASAPPASTVTKTETAPAQTITITATQVQSIAGPTQTKEETSVIEETSVLTQPVTIVNTVAGPTQTKEETQVQTQLSTVVNTVAGPTQTKEETVQGPTQVVTSEILSTVVNTIPGPTNTVEETHVLTQTAVQTIPGPTQTHVITSEELSTIVNTIAGPTNTVEETKVQTVPVTNVQTQVVTSVNTVTLPGSTQVVTKENSEVITQTAPAQTVEKTEVQTAPAQTVVQSAPAQTIVASSAQQSSPAPVQSSAAQSPAQSAPAQSAPAQSAPAQSAPAQSAPAQSAPAQSTPAQSASAPSSSACPANLQGSYEYPHLIVPVSSAQPDTPLGTSYNGEVSPSVSSIFNFDIPQGLQGQTCSLIFLFPNQGQLTTSSFNQSSEAGGSIDFSQLSGPASQTTDYANAPKVAQDLGTQAVAPGNSYTIASGPCAAGQTLAYELSSVGGYSLEYFQDFNPSAIGLYVRAC